MQLVYKLPAVVAGALLSLGAWLLLVPWDLSELDADGHMLEQGGDDYAPMIVLVAAAVIALAVGLLVSPRTRRSAAWFATGGLVAWAVLFAWRTAVSETSGANMFMIPLLFAVIPLTIAVPAALLAVGNRLDDSAQRSRVRRSIRRS